MVKAPKTQRDEEDKTDTINDRTSYLKKHSNPWDNKASSIRLLNQDLHTIEDQQDDDEDELTV